MKSTRIPAVVLLMVGSFLTACSDATGPESFDADRAATRQHDRSESDSSSDDASSSSDSGAMTNAVLQLRCEVRMRGRSQISVDGKNLVSGMYSAVVSSGGIAAATGLQSTVGDEVEFDFDSDPDDIADGANAIAADFIRTSGSPHVSASILDAQGQTVVSAGGNCDIRR